MGRFQDSTRLGIGLIDFSPARTRNLLASLNSDSLGLENWDSARLGEYFWVYDRQGEYHGRIPWELNWKKILIWIYKCLKFGRNNKIWNLGRWVLRYKKLLRLVIYCRICVEFGVKFGVEFFQSDTLLINLLCKIRHRKFRHNSDTKFDTNPTVDDQPH